MFHFKYLKPAEEIVEKAKLKVVKLSEQIAKREVRIADLRREYDIDDAALIQLLLAAREQQKRSSQAPTSFLYSKSVARPEGGKQMEETSIGAGVVNNLLTENDFIESESSQIKKLELLIRNLKPIPRYAANGARLPDEEFQLSAEELTFLGF